MKKELLRNKNVSATGKAFIVGPAGAPAQPESRPAERLLALQPRLLRDLTCLDNGGQKLVFALATVSGCRYLSV
jgi:hypothetical protein